MDYKDIETLPLYLKAIKVREIGTVALVCGWGTVSQDNLFKDAIGDAQYSQNLHCMNIDLLGPLSCQKILLARDFKTKLMCGRALRKHQKITLVTFHSGNKLTCFF